MMPEVNFSKRKNKLSGLSSTLVAAFKASSTTSLRNAYVTLCIIATGAAWYGGIAGALIVSTVLLAAFLINHRIRYINSVAALQVTKEHEIAAMLPRNATRAAEGRHYVPPELIEPLEAIVAWLMDPRKFQRLGGVVPRLKLFIGLPASDIEGIVLSHLTKADVPIFMTDGEQFVISDAGFGPRRIHKLFDQGKRAAPSIVMINNLHAICVAEEYREQPRALEHQLTRLALIAELSSPLSREGTMFVGTSDTPHMIHSSILERFGSADVVTMARLSSDALEAALRHYTKSVKLAEGVDLKTVVMELNKKVVPYTSVHIETIVKTAALRAAEKGHKGIAQEEIIEVVRSFVPYV